MEHQNLTKAFDHYLTTTGYHASSRRMIISAVAEFLGSIYPQALQNLRPKDLEAYHQYLENRPNERTQGGLSASYIYHHIYSLKTFFAWLEATDRLRPNPISYLNLPHPERHSPSVLWPREIQKLYQAAYNHKEKALLALLYGCGLRKSEAVALDKSDLDLDNRFVYIQKGKGNRRRVVPLAPKVTRDLQNYIRYERHTAPGETALITGMQGYRLKGSGYYNRFQKLLHRAGITRGVTLHSLRHSIATHLLWAGLSLEEVRDFLGHKHLESTRIYTRVLPSQLPDS